MIAGSVGHRTGTRNISDLGGITDKMPLTGGFMMIAFMASLGFPGPIITVVATAAYYIFAMQRAIFGPYNEKLGKVKDMEPFEIVPLGILSFLFALFGILPFLFMEGITTWARFALLGLGGG
jgi:NADH-quinone oxidoreductase subunit M